MKRHMVAATTVVALLFLLTLGASRASADVLTFALTSDHCTGGCLGASTSAGTITVTDISGGVTIGVSLNTGFEFMGGASGNGFEADFGFNLNPHPTIAGSSSPTGFDLVSTTSGSLHMAGTGFFGYGFLGTFGKGSGNAMPGPYTFTVTGSGVTSGSFVQNAASQFFAVDVYSSSTRNTGGVDASVLPDGGMTLMLLGGALVGLETLRRRFRA